MGEGRSKGWGIAARWAAVAIVGTLVGSVLLGPAMAHLNSPLTFGHLKKHFFTKKLANQRFYTKADADAKFLDSTEGNTTFLNVNELETKVATGAAPFTTTSTTYGDVTGASATVTVPAGQTSLIIAEFTAESFCDASDDSGYCTVRILIGGTEGNPAEGTNFAFDTIVTATANEDWWEGNAMTRSRGPLGPGTYTVQVQAATVDGNANTTFNLDDWHLTVQRVPA
jgi:hypothetical protein